MSEEKREVYQKAWHIQVPGLKLIDFTRDRRGIVTFDKENVLRLFDHNGNELWHRPAGYDLVSVSLSDTLEVLAVDVDKHIILYGLEGATLWRKRPFPAMMGRISASGEFFSFVTSDPAIVGTDRALRVKWAYRNLMKKPADMAISGAGQVTTFPCSDDRGDGVAAVNRFGKPYDPFMGMKTIVAVDVSEDGQCILALDDAGGLFCVNPVRGYGIWKGKNSPRNTGVSYASQTGDSIAYSDQGRIVKFDPKGNIIWEYSFTERLLRAFISPDSNAIYYATERGEIGCLRKNIGDGLNKVEFMEKKIKESSAAKNFVFRKIWHIELAGNRENLPLVKTWQGYEGVEYSLVWNGRESLLCLNDVGEEVWQKPMGETRVADISVSVDADIVLLATNSGLVGFDLDGNESFRILGIFKEVHVFPDGAMLLLDENNLARFYYSSDHFSHSIEVKEQLRKIVSIGENVVLVGEKAVSLVNYEGTVFAEAAFDSRLTFFDVTNDSEHFLVGEESGQLHILDAELKEVFAYKLPGPVGLVGFVAKEKDVIAAVKGKPEVMLLRFRTNDILKNSLTGNPVSAIEHNAGMIVATDLDQLGLMGFDGNILGRYTCPDRVIKILSCRRPGCFLLLTEDALTCIGVVQDSRGPGRRPD
ncbi:MAG: hypothetical protein Kow0029_04490 [Candidatus Rifleibacteriota bacterium]